MDVSRRTLLLGLSASAFASPAPEPPLVAVSAVPVTLTTDEDYALMLRRLGIDSVRPGRNGMAPNAANYAHYDEAIANPFPDWPNALITNGGARVTSAQMWRSVRRPELVELFDREIFGRTPTDTPGVSWQLKEKKDEQIGSVAAKTQRFIGRVDNHFSPAIEVNLDMQISRPANASGQIPVVLNFLWIDPPPWFRPPAEPVPDWRESILERGWACAILDPNSVQADNGAGLTRGIIGLMNQGQPRKVDDWGALKAWTWGGSRVLDFLEGDGRFDGGCFDAGRVAIQGHSRYGKAALVAMAYEPRLKVGFISSSGKGGAAPFRRDWGEIVENVAGQGEYHWMAGNFIKYAGPLNWGDIPVDAHELIALAAPRPLFISSGAQNGDGWVDARGMFMATAAAGPVYSLLGARDLGTDQFPEIEHGLLDGDLAFRQHSAGHTPGPNWPYFLNFAARYFEG